MMMQAQPQNSNRAQQDNFRGFVATIAALRAPNGCPWDREQTHASIAHNMVEEAYEAVDAIESNDIVHLREELGDVLLQVVLQSQIAADAGEFTIDEVCADVNAKMIRRHPHVFGDASATKASEVLDLWDSVKLSEKGAADDAVDDAGIAREGMLDGVPTSFPSLMQAQKISRKAVAAGFEWDTVDEVWDKVAEEVAEFKAATTAAEREMEFGDVLFALVNVARKQGVDAESALRASCGKFRSRWAFIEGAAGARGLRVEELTAQEREGYWNEAKQREGRD